MLKKRVTGGLFSGVSQVPQLRWVPACARDTIVANTHAQAFILSVLEESHQDTRQRSLCERFLVSEGRDELEEHSWATFQCMRNALPFNIL